MVNPYKNISAVELNKERLEMEKFFPCNDYAEWSVRSYKYKDADLRHTAVKPLQQHIFEVWLTARRNGGISLVMPEHAQAYFGKFDCNGE